MAEFLRKSADLWFSGSRVRIPGPEEVALSLLVALVVAVLLRASGRTRVILITIPRKRGRAPLRKSSTPFSCYLTPILPHYLPAIVEPCVAEFE
jgi:hypothetical protein